MTKTTERYNYVVNFYYTSMQSNCPLIFTNLFLFVNSDIYPLKLLSISISAKN